MPKQGVVGIALNVDYDKALKEMVSGFNQALTQISNRAKKIEYAGDVKEQIKGIKGEIKGFSDEFRAELKKINDQQIDSSGFKKFEADVTERFENIEKKFASINTKIQGLKTQLGLLEGSDTASKMKDQFDDWRKSIVNTYQELQKVVDLVDTNKSQDMVGVNVKDIQEQLKIYRSTLRDIQKMRTEKNKLSNVKDDFHLNEELKAMESLKEIAKKSGIEQIERDLEDAEKSIKTTFSNIKSATKELNTLDVGTVDYTKKISDIATLRSEAVKTAKSLEYMNLFLTTYGAHNESYSYKGLKDRTWDYIDKVNGDLETKTDTSSFLYQIDQYISQAEKFIEQNKNVKDSVDTVTTAINTFTIKNGAIQIPIEVAKDKEVLGEITKAMQSMQSYVDKHPVVAQVKLVLDGQSTKAYKTQGDIAKQLEDGQNKPAVDISKAIKKTYIQSVKEAEEAANKAINKIKSMFDSSPIKISIDDKAFTEELSTMVSSSLGKIANDSTGLNVNQELEKLIGNLKEVSTSLSGNDSFKFGLDEASIERITSAIKDMADMIQRAFGVASNEDIAAQWSAIEGKFKGVAGEEGKLLKGNKEHKIAIQELAVEYKKYLDMGGKNDLSTLTDHKQTVKNITAEYESLSKAAQEAAQKQEKAKKKTASTKVSSEEKDVINAVSRENKKLETQAGKTSAALENEGKSAQSASEKFRKLAKEKGAAAYANRELAKAAKETADALEREAKVRKESGAKAGKNAVDGNVYNDNSLKWQSDIKKSLMDSGNYAEVYDAKISQAANGTVKFTAVIRDLDGALKKFSANVNDSGNISAPAISDMSEKQAANFEKNLIIAEKAREAMANAGDNAVQPISLDKESLDLYLDEARQLVQTLKEANTTHRIDLTNDGKFLITRKELSETGAEVKTFTATIDRVDNILEKTADGVHVSAEKIKDALNGAFDSAKVSVSTKDLAASAQNAFDAFYRKNQGDVNFKEISFSLDTLKNEIATIDSQGKLDDFKQKLKDLGVTLKNVGKDNKLGELFEGETRTFANINEVRNNLDSLFASVGKVNEKSIRITGANKLTAEVKAANGEIRKMAVSLDSNGFARFVDTGIVEFGRLKAAAQNVLKSMQGMVRIYLSPQDFIRYFSSGFNMVKEMDTAMTELRKVSDASPEDLVAYFDDAVDSAKELGSSVKDMISATADWSRNGYNLPDSKQLAEVAVLYKNVGDGIDIDSANESLVSTLQGFQMSSEDAIKIVDSFNEVANNYSISSAGIGEALKRSAAAFNAANTDLNQAIALITAGNEIVQSPEKVGTMWQTVSARIRGTKSELEELGESTEDVLSTSKLQSLVKAYTDVDIMKSATEYKDIYTIISEIGEKWKELEDVERANNYCPDVQKCA